MIAKFTRKDFLEALFSPYYKEHRGFILVKSFKRGDPKMSTRYFPNIEILAKEHYGEERDVYYGICPRERMKSEKEHIHYLVALWADLDIGSEGHEEKQVFFQGPQHAAKAIRSFPRAPSLIVESGRGAHLYWLLKDVHRVDDPERIEKVLKNISDHLQCDTDVNLDTVLRLPETLNTKIPGKPANCDVKFINANFRYSLDDFENLAKPMTAPPPARPATAPLHTGQAIVPPSFVDDVESQPQREVTGPGEGIDDSLVLDETIIDELIDDISMAGSVVTDSPPSGIHPVHADAPIPQLSPRDRGAAAPREGYDERPALGMVPATSSMLARLSAARTEVEISLVGSSTVLRGTLVWNENGLIGIEAGEDHYTIPLSSVSFIKNSAV
jgi:hypothetical protein